MIELKFRIWDNLKKVYLQNIRLHPIRLDNGVSGFIQHPEGHTIEQFTGFLDKEGVEVYEGDIIERGPYNHQFGKTSVIFKHGSFIETKYHYTLSFLAGTAFEMDVLKDFRVIGNIHQHPELLDSTLKKD